MSESTEGMGSSGSSTSPGIVNIGGAGSSEGPQFFSSVAEAMSGTPSPSREGTGHPNVMEESIGDPEADQEEEGLEASDEDGDEEAVEEAAEEEVASDEPFLTIKVNGEDHPLTAEQAKILAQKGLGAEEKFKEAVQIRREAESLIKQLKQDPLSILTDPRLGVNFRQLAEDYLYEQYSFESKPEIEREAIEAKKKLEKYEAAEKARKAQEEQTKIERATQFYVDKFQREIGKEIEASGIPDTMWATQRAIHYLKQALDKGVKASAADVMGYVAEDYGAFRNRAVENMSPEQLTKFLGEDHLKRAWKHQRSLQKKNDPAAQFPPSVKGGSANITGRDSSGRFGKGGGYVSSTKDIFG